ncbi:hypothetical protein B0H10DRAFT_1997895 [Mycena sp. CBHHK59/15]|nr:hypothetical protein B0H10DRAFT_1997895 [Mycena sp. CBHHK59/15]
MSRSPSMLYRLACAFSLLQIGSGLATVLVYEVDDARDSQFIAILYAINTFYMVYMLIPHTTRKDSDPISRLNKQFVIINFLLLCWVLSVGMVPLTVGSGITHVISSCLSERFMSPICVTIGIDMALPFALIFTLGTVSWSIYTGARSLQAREPFLQQPPPSPAFQLRPARTARPATETPSRDYKPPPQAESV